MPDELVIGQIDQYGEPVTAMSDVDDYADPPGLEEIQAQQEAVYAAAREARDAAAAKGASDE